MRQSFLFKHMIFILITVMVGVGVAYSLKSALLWTIHSGPMQLSYFFENILTKNVDLLNMETMQTAVALSGAQSISKPDIVIDESKNEEEPHLFKDIISSVRSTDTGLSVTAKSFIVIDLETNKPIFERDADRAVPIASITKLMTAIVARREMDQYERVTISQSALATYGSSAKLRSGEKFTVGELMYPLLMVSSNDAAEVLARTYGRKEFIKKMNEWASTIGAYHSYFYDPSGLSQNNITSARDISLIMRWIEKNQPDLLDITLTKVKNIRVHTWVNPTHLLNLTTYKGGKNGFTDEAGRTGAAIFYIEEEGKIKRYAVVVLDSTDRDRDILELLEKV